MARAIAFGILILFTSVISACSNSRIPADSIEETIFSEFPESRYLRVKGIGDSEPEARRRAISEMSNVFESEISSEVSSRAESIIGDDDETFAKRVRETILIKSNVRLQGVQVAETWASGGNHYAMAVLDKAAARRTWIEQIESLDRRISAEAGVYRQNPENLLLRLRSGSVILAAWIEKQVLKDRLRVVGVPHTVDLTDEAGPIIRELPKIKSRMRIHVDINGPHSAVIRDRITGVLTSEGFIFSGERDRADVLIKGESSLDRLDLDREKWRFVRAHVSLVVKDRKTGSGIAQIAEDVRAAHISYEEASQKAIREVSDLVARKIAAKFMAAGEGL